LEHVSRPCLILQHQIDALTPLRVGDYLHENLKGSTLKVIEATGHCAHMSHPALLIDAMKRHFAEQGA
jgi:sigma-B regulation protein RsbQ